MKDFRRAPRVLSANTKMFRSLESSLAAGTQDEKLKPSTPIVLWLKVKLFCLPGSRALMVYRMPVDFWDKSQENDFLFSIARSQARQEEEAHDDREFSFGPTDARMCVYVYCIFTRCKNVGKFSSFSSSFILSLTIKNI